MIATGEPHTESHAGEGWRRSRAARAAAVRKGLDSMFEIQVDRSEQHGLHRVLNDAAQDDQQQGQGADVPRHEASAERSSTR
jgi:hypothetical protein